MKPEQGAAAIRSLVDRLSEGDEVGEAMAREGVAAAQRAAGLRPHPQSGLAASTLTLQGNTISVSSPLFWGSERGSTIYRQFHGRSERGSWLFPSLEDAAVADAGDEALQGILDSVT